MKLNIIENDPSLTRKNKLILHFLILSIILVFIRIPLLGIFQKSMYSRYLNLTPVLFLFFCLFLKIEQWKKIKKIILLYGVVLLPFLINFLFFDFSFKNIIVNRGSSTLLFLIFPIIASNIFNKNEIIYIIDVLVKALSLVFFSFNLIIFFMFHILHIQDHHLIAYFFPDQVFKTMGDSYNFHTFGRRIGLLISPDFSALAVSSYLIYFFNKFFVSPRKYDVVIMFFLFLNCISLILTSTIFVTSINFSVMLLSIFFFSAKLFKKIALILISSCYFLFSFYDKILYNKMENYLNNHHYYLSLFKPNVSNCDWKSILYPSIPIIAYEDSCTPKEIHSLYYILDFGFLTVLPWVIFLLFPVFAFVKLRKDKNLAPIFFCCLVYLLGCLHYSGVESWGNNYFYSFLVLYLFFTYKKLA